MIGTLTKLGLGGYGVSRNNQFLRGAQVVIVFTKGYAAASDAPITRAVANDGVVTRAGAIDSAVTTATGAME